MPLPKTFNWRESAPHIDALSKFLKPREAAQVARWQYLEQVLGETPARAIERFIDDGSLVPCDVSQSLDCLCSASDIKRVLKELGQKQTGSKSELIERLIDTDLGQATKLVAGRKVLVCSDTAVAFVEQWQKTRESATLIAEQKCYRALVAGNAAEAVRIRFDYFRQYPRENEFIADTSYLAETVSDILNAKPDALRDLSEGDIVTLRVATAMKELWRRNAIAWIPEDYSCPVELDRAISYIECAAGISRALRNTSHYAHTFKLEFNEYDVDSCPQCKSLSGKTFSVENFPRLPLMGCTSTTGCKCDVMAADTVTTNRIIVLEDGEEVEENSMELASSSEGEQSVETSEHIARINDWVVQLSPNAVECIYRLVQYMCEAEGVEMEGVA